MSETFPQEFGRYQLTERLALGGMAELFLAEAAGAHGFAKTVVIKRILPHLAADTNFTSMFIAEAKITAQLAHPKIAQTFELGNEDKQLFIVMEFIDGLDVLALLRESAHRRVRVPEEITVHIIKEVLDALDFAHNLCGKSGEHLGIVHRDVSPSNILLSKRGDVKLVDFGIAHAAAQDGQTKSGTLKGKYGYMSPEQVLGQDVSPKSDVFAAGIVMSEMLMGRRLFAAANELDVLLMVRDVDLSRLERFGEHIQPDLANLLRWALRKDPGDRYKDAKTFRDSLDEWLFEQRHRIGATQLADIVNSLYADADARRKEGLEADAKGAPPPVREQLASLVGAAPVAKKSAASARAATPIRKATSLRFGESLADLELGVPAGLAERPPDDEPSSVIEVSLGKESESAALGMELVSPDATTTKAPRRRPPGLDDVSDEIVNFELAPADSLNIDMALDLAIGEEPEGEAVDLGGPEDVDLNLGESEEVDLDDMGESEEVNLGEPELGIQSESFEVDFGSLNDDEDEVSSAPKKTPSYDSISAAVASVSPLAPDPASIDFDDSNVSGQSRRGRMARLPTTAELEQSEPPKPPSLKQGSEEAERIGSLSEQSALATLYSTTVARESGKVALNFGGVRKEIFFKRGVPEFVSSNIASELFGAYLVRMEVISSGELDMALAVMPHFGGKLGDTLVGLGLMKPLEVFRHLTRQVRSKLLEVCTWTQGDYEWYPGVPCPKQAFPLDLDPLEVYGAAALAMPRESLDAFLERHEDKKYTAARSLVVVPELFQVPGIRTYQERFDGTQTLKRVVASLDTDDDELRQLQVVYLLVNTKLVAEAEGTP